METSRPAVPPAPPPAGSRAAWRPNRYTWMWAALALLAGVVLFLLAIRHSRNDTFFHAGDGSLSTGEPQYAPLPAPETGNAGSGIEVAPAPPVDTSEAASAPTPQPVPVQAPPRPAPAPASRPTAASQAKARPIPGQTPPPEYPASALLHGEGGTSLVIVHVGPDGVPTAVELAQGSGSRDLDRAAMQAVRRWRFQPAMENGHPTVDTVVVPVDFRPGD